MITLSPARHSNSCKLDDWRLKFPFPPGERNFPLFLNVQTGSGAHPEGEISSSFRRFTSSEVWNSFKYHMKRHFLSHWKTWCVSLVFYYLNLQIKTLRSFWHVSSYLPVDTTRLPSKFRSSYPLWEPPICYAAASWLRSANECCLVKYRCFLRVALIWKTLIHSLCKMK